MLVEEDVVDEVWLVVVIAVEMVGFVVPGAAVFCVIQVGVGSLARLFVNFSHVASNRTSCRPILSLPRFGRRRHPHLGDCFATLIALRWSLLLSFASIVPRISRVKLRASACLTRITMVGAQVTVAHNLWYHLLGESLFLVAVGLPSIKLVNYRMREMKFSTAPSPKRWRSALLVITGSQHIRVRTKQGPLAAHGWNLGKLWSH